MSDQKYFNQALGNFIQDAASGGAIRHLADLGYTPAEIAARLDWPTPKDRVAKTVFDHFVSKGKICLEDPAEKPVVKYHYKKTMSPTGRTGLVRVSEEIPTDDREYVIIDYGKRIYQNKEAFAKRLETAGLEEKDMEYLLDMPWPLKPVWHEMDDRMTRIQKKLNQ